ncbi:prolyl-tRNA synthetase associated domain-containing protein [Pinisolibacter aquiterrae]|uniref:prolyl-tRNA synthetase associated domain-containing protein n=1 Tax=Pinisolibacter aquiterrae TaxID=2815579 RepID=UPI001C3CF664|nr:prolyl-tRNA synthetase associated domain-containing protein [Pinisolibacter aquiterrae]MBV5266191.1 prolyl-tRNA synthetase associated domain-containing protein [Pinisolibacter aquiterrae]MCC8236279.1 prolyl-tRNA synthetase associated domain-containing protein [Pinisolibacter aquiterrae]
MPITRAELLARLADLGIATTTRDHEAVFTVAESRSVKAVIPGAHSKNLFLKDKKGRIFLVTAEGDAAIDLKAISGVIGASGRVTFGKPELLLDLVGVTPGSVTPFGIVNDTEGRVTVVIDAAMMEHEILNFHPLENTATTSIRREDFVRFLEATGHPPLIVAVSNGKVVFEP